MSSKATILVVDDDPDIVESLTLVLESESYQVAAAFNADEALEKVEALRPDLILLDVMMPEGTEGFQFVWKLRNEYPQELAHTPIVVLTSIHDTTPLRFYPQQSDGTYEPGEYLPVQGFIDKPADPPELLKRVAQVLAENAE
jgi:CheY-like chemotaxis protein